MLFFTITNVNIRWPSSIKILGIYIGYNKVELEHNNLRKRIDKMKNLLNMWRQRSLTLYGKILIIKTFALSQILYAMSVLNIPDNYMKEIDEIIYEFLWSCKQHKVKKRVIIQSLENGGCGMIDLAEIDKVQKLKWIKKILECNRYAVEVHNEYVNKEKISFTIFAK